MTCKEQKIPTDKENIKKDSLFIRVDGSLHQIAFADIVYVEGLKDYVKFYIEQRKTSVDKSFDYEIL